jgi:hypothetical protein
VPYTYLPGGTGAGPITKGLPGRVVLDHGTGAVRKWSTKDTVVSVAPP